jgi:hypothetical protein
MKTNFDKYKEILESAIYENCGNYYIGGKALQKVLDMHKRQLKFLNIPFVNTRNCRLVMLHDYNVVKLEWKRPHTYIRCLIGGFIWRFMPDLTFKHRRFMIVDYGC